MELASDSHNLECDSYVLDGRCISAVTETLTRPDSEKPTWPGLRIYGQTDIHGPARETDVAGLAPEAGSSQSPLAPTRLCSPAIKSRSPSPGGLFIGDFSSPQAR